MVRAKTNDTIVPRAELEALIDELLAEPRGVGHLYQLRLDQRKAGEKMLALDRESQAALVPLLSDRLNPLERRLKVLVSRLETEAAFGASAEQSNLVFSRHLLALALNALLRRKLPLTDTTLLGLLEKMDPESEAAPYLPSYLTGLASALERRAAEGELGEDLARQVARLSDALEDREQVADRRVVAARLRKLITSGPEARIKPGEAWSDVALGDLEAMPSAHRAAWHALLASCQQAGAGKPGVKWLKSVRPMIEAVGRSDFKDRLLRWLPLVDRPRTVIEPRRNRWEPPTDDLIEPPHVELLKGLAWCASLEDDRDLARALAALVVSSYRKIPGRGPRLTALGNATVAALGMMPGMDAVGQLALLKVKIKFIPAQKEIEKALTAAAGREGLPRDEIDELAVPAYGMEEVGRRVDVLGEYTAEIIVEGPDARLRWSKAGKPLKSIPAAVKKEHGEEVKDLQAAVKDVGKMLTAQRERIDGLFLARKSWPYDVWRTRYLDHPLVGAIARRLIWRFTTDDGTIDGAWLDDHLVGVDDIPIEGLGETSKVALWHPIGLAIEDVTAWRDWLDRHRVRQPFKQAHREVYVLTDAERNTRVYSNRFAAHILRQHQYHALCAARGWRDRLRLMVDDAYPPSSRDLPEWGLRAEFWIEGIGDHYGRDTTDSGSYLYLNTDQVRFYEIGAAQLQAHAGGGGYSTMWGRADAEPVALDRIPALVLSEIFRDVDLFVGVASVGNDPNWSDGGPEGRHVDYWRQYGFGDLSANGQTRKSVLERLIPRLKIAPRCSFSDKFLIVKGDLRTYKIHLGSGNILMEPNDQYLCIVAKRGGGDGSATGPVFLPFEGDATLSIVLSKALMLAEDTKITDPTIVSQIKR